jgi:lipase chaperone LimK
MPASVMQNPAATPPTARAKLLYAAAAILFGLAVWFLHSDGEAALPGAAAAQGEAAARFGPGVWTAPHAAATAEAPTAALDTAAPGGLATTADRRLVVNKALHDVVDYFLFGGHPGERSTHVARLLVHLKANLPEPAYGEAAQIVQNYLRYIQEHDQLLARESMSAPGSEGAVIRMDFDRVAAWIAQRTRLRQNLLGFNVAQAWFGDEEAETERDLAAMRKPGAGAAPENAMDPDPQQQASTSLDAMRSKGVPLESQREYIAARFGAEAARRFDAVEREEQAWQARYADYRRSAGQINRQSGIDPADRARQIEALQAQLFLTEPERLRARALDRQ